MTHPPQESPTHYEWSKAKSLLPRRSQCERGLTGALIPNSGGENDHIAVVYDEGDLPPKITIKQISGSVHTVMANDVAVAVIASAHGHAPHVSDVLLIKRCINC